MKRNRFINPETGTPSTEWSSVAYKNRAYFKHVRIINDLNLLKGRKMLDVVYVDEYSPIVFKVEGILNPLFLMRGHNDWGFKITTDIENRYYLTWDRPNSLKFTSSLWIRLKEIGLVSQKFEDDYKEALVVSDFENYEFNIKYHTEKLEEAKKELEDFKKEYKTIK